MLLVTGVVALHVAVAAIFAFGSQQRTSAPIYDVAKATMPIHTWAFIFAAVAVAIGVATWMNRNTGLAIGCAIGCGLCMWWAVITGLSAHEHPQSGFVGIVLWLGVAFLHVATAVAAVCRPLRST